MKTVLWKFVAGAALCGAGVLVPESVRGEGRAGAVCASCC